MKKYIFLIVVLITTISVAQTTNGINYKALIKDDLGNVLVSQTIDVKFTIIADNGPTDVYTETYTGVSTDANGITVLNIGEGTTTDVFTDIIWRSDTHSLKTEIDTEQDGTFEFVSTTQFMAVPYALHATTATTALNAGATSIDDLIDGKTYANGRSLFLGIDAGSNDDGTINNNNVGVGYKALNSNTTGFDNTANGYQALYQNTFGDSNVANGSAALFSNTTGSGNTANGVLALYQNTTGYLNTANGVSTLYSNISGYWNTANGYQALFSNITGIGNVALGYKAGFLETGSNKLYIANSDTTTPLVYGDFDTEILTINGDLQVTGNISGGGINDLNDGKADTNGSSLFLGIDAGANDDGSNNSNVGVGYQALQDNTTGRFNTANGNQALWENMTGESNTAMGNIALRQNITGTGNTAIGGDALRQNTTGFRNTATGRASLLFNTTGDFNTANGNDALHENISGNGNVALGYKAGYFETGNNTLYIANTDTNTPLIYGEFDNEILTINGKATVNESTSSTSTHALSGIKTHTGNHDAYGVYGENTVADFYGYGVYGKGGFIGVRGQVNATGTNSYYGVRGNVSGGSGANYGVYGSSNSGATNYAVYAAGDLAYSGTLISTSDRKLKTNINRLNNGITTIMSLQPSTYSFKESYQKSMQVSNKPQFGFMAQELQIVLPELVSENKHPGANKDDQEISYLGINYIGLIPILTAGMQEQQEHIKTLEDKIESQNQSIESLISRIEAIENR